jgi:MFS family permease
VLLRDHLDASPDVAAAALSVFLGAVTVGRLAGDRLVDRFGPVSVFRAGALTAGGGLTVGLVVHTPGSALAGLALFGAGLAPLLPVIITAASAEDEVPVPVAVARVSMIGYLGSFVGPGVIGLTASSVGLSLAMLLPAALVALTALAAHQVASATRQPTEA